METTEHALAAAAAWGCFTGVVLEVHGPELPLLPATGAGDEARVNIGLHLRLVRLEAARAHLGHARVQPTVDEDRVAILGDGQVDVLEPPGSVLERLRKGRDALDLYAFLGNFRYLDDHG